MRIQTKRTLQVALASGGLLMVGAGSAPAAETVTPDVPASPLDQLGTDLRHPVPAADAPAPAVVLHTVPVHLLQHELVPSAEVGGDLSEPDLNAPLGSELAATALPVLPVAVPLTATADTAPSRAAVTPVDGRLPVLPLSGDVVTRPLDPGAGTRVTGLHTAAVPVQAVVPTQDRRADTPAATLPLLGGLTSSTNGVLPTRAPALNGLSDVTRLVSLTGLTQLAGSTPLTHGGRYNTGVVTAPLTGQGPGALVEPATALLRK
jgi:hypothetical protein